MDKASKDVLTLLALELNYIDIISLCSTSKRTNRYVCQNKNFWKNKLRKDFGFVFLSKNPQILYKELDRLFNIDKIENYDEGLYKSVRIGNRELVNYFIFKGANNWKYALKGAVESRNRDLIVFFQKLNK